MIRKALIDDLPAIESCVKQAYSVYTDRLGFEPKPMHVAYDEQIAEGIVHVAVDDDGDLQGYIIFSSRDDVTILENLAVSPNHQGKGVGKYLINFCEADARRNGHRAVELFTHKKMTENRRLYPRLGYREVSRREDDKLDRVSFRKELG